MVKNKKTSGSLESSRSVRRTKMALRNSLIELMKNKSILRITVTDICDLADVGRSTFYDHYENHYELLEELQLECLSFCEENSKQPLCNYSDIEFIQWFEKILHYIADNSNSIQTLLSENGDISFQRKFIQCFIKNVKNAKNQHKGTQADDVRNDFYSIFIVNGTISLLQYWLKNDISVPVSDLAKMFVSFIRE